MDQTLQIGEMLAARNHERIDWMKSNKLLVICKHYMYTSMNRLADVALSDGATLYVIVKCEIAELYYLIWYS